MSSKINARIGKLKDIAEVAESLSKTSLGNTTANGLYDKFSNQALNLANKLIDEITAMQDGSKARGLTLTPVHEMRMPALAVQNFLAEVRSPYPPAGVFYFRDKDNEKIVLDEIEIEWLYKRLHVDNLAFAEQVLESFGAGSKLKAATVFRERAQLIDEVIDEIIDEID